ncbi:MAG: ABC transporter substrate-binding protein [candidate division WOR-3 bacterium]|nr:ABC transporter substrate-binding protein [candidate division WOR-3 bacterium]
MGGPLGKTLESMVRDFEKQNPDIKITLVGMGDYSALAQKLMGAIAVDNPPTIAQVYESWTTQFYQQNQLFPLDSFVHSPSGLSSEELADIYPVFVENNMWDGKFLTFPFNKSVPVYFYNIAMFDSTGIKEFPKTWSDFRIALKRLTRDLNNDGKPEIYGTGGGVNSWLFGCMLYQKSSKLLDETKKKVEFNSPAAIEALQYMIDLIYKDSTTNFISGYEPQNDFLQGKLALIFGTIVSWAFMKDKMTFPIGIAPLPSWDKPAVLAYGTNIALFRKSSLKQKEAAWRFIKWFTRPKQQARWASETFYVPVCKQALREPVYAKLLQEIKGLKESIEQLNYATFEPRGEEWFAGRRYLGEAMEEAIRLKTSPKKALDNAAYKLQKEWQ